MHIITDAEANLNEEELNEWPDYALNTSKPNLIFKSFKPGVDGERRKFLTTPGESKVKMCEKNKPLILKKKLLNYINN